MRGSIVWAGLPDPGNTRAGLAEQTDDETGLLKALVHAWPSTPISIAKAMELATEPSHRVLAEVLAELPDRQPEKQLAYLLRGARGRNFGWRRFDRVENTRPTQWVALDV